jgi:hypothetical protein
MQTDLYLGRVLAPAGAPVRWTYPVPGPGLLPVPLSLRRRNRLRPEDIGMYDGDIFQVKYVMINSQLGKRGGPKLLRPKSQFVGLAARDAKELIYDLQERREYKKLKREMDMD